jgi:glycosyltransferase involved in cell wall biosynthesis
MTRLVLAGAGPLDADLRALAGELGLGANVEFAGWCGQDRLAKLYSRAHLFLHPSELTEAGDQEGIPNALLEAMATGLPAVATRHGGIPEAVTDGVDGLLVPEKSPEALGDAILRFMASPALIESASRAAPVNIAANFGAAEQIQALEDCYEEALRE